MDAERRLSKTDFVAGERCLRLLWYRRHARHLAADPPPERQRVLDAGETVDTFAQTAYPGGALVASRALSAAAEETVSEIRRGARRIYQATWVTDWGGFRADIADVDDAEGSIVLREVKASLGVKPHHLTDLAFQAAVVQDLGWEVAGARLVHLDPSARVPDPPLVEVDVSAEVAARVDAVAATSQRLLEQTGDAIPDSDRGSRCVLPHRCPFLDACWGPLPSPSVLDVPGLAPRRLDREVGSGVRAAVDVSRSGLSRDARRYVQALDGGLAVDRRVLAAWTASLVEPVAALVLAGPHPPLSDHTGHRAYDLVPTAVGMAVRDGDVTAWRAADPAGLGPPLDAAFADVGTIVVFDRDETLQALRLLQLKTPTWRVEARLSDVAPVLHRAIDHPRLGGDRSLGAYAVALVGQAAPGSALADARVPDVRAAASTLLSLVAAARRLTEAA